MIWYVALGSAVGGVARFLLAAFVQQRVGPNFPTGTLVVNISGSLLLGFLWRYALGTDVITPEVRALLTELTVGEPGEQVRLHDRGVSDDRCRAIENIVQHAQGSGRIAVLKADHRA